MLQQRHRHRHQHRQQLNVAFPYALIALIALFALCARCSLCARPDRALARRSTRLRRATPSPFPPSLTLATPSFPLCHFEPTVAELVVIALRWLHFRSLNSLLRLGYVSDAFAARIPSFLPSSFFSYPPPYPPLFVLQPAFAELTVLTCLACLYALFALCAFDTLCSFCARSAPCCVVAR